jgi:hypothetical protein
MFVTKFEHKSWLKDFQDALDNNKNSMLKRSARLIRRKVRAKAKKMKVTGNLAKGVYIWHNKDKSIYAVGIHKPAFHAYLVEFGHKARNGKRVPAYPIVYSTYRENAKRVGALMTKPLNWGGVPHV